MRTGKQLLSLLLTALTLYGTHITASAHPVPDLTKTGSITVAMRYQDKAVPGGSLTLYRVGDVDEDGGDYSFVPTGDFKGCVAAFDEKNIQSPELAKELADYAETKKLSAVGTKTAGKDGNVTFSGLELGLYLLVQETAAPGYGKMSPFLVSVPYLEDNQYVYDVKSAPKTDLEREVTPTETAPHGPTLPQTGQLNWPVPVLVVLGLTLFTIGWALRFGKKRDENEP